MFSIILNIVGSLLHLYVSVRLFQVPLIRRRIGRRAWIAGAVAVWVLYIVGIQLGDEALDWRWWPGQFAVNWLGILFVMAMCLLAADLVSGFGVYQAVRPPVVVEQELLLENLPPALDGTVLVAMADLHLGAQRRSAWLADRVAQINALAPDVVVMVGDQVEGGAIGEPQLPAVLRRLQPPLGVWAVTGNHEFHRELAAIEAEFAAGGVRWLRNASAEIAPGLVLNGIDDIGAAMRRGDDYLAPLAQVLEQRPAGAAILLSHIPAPAVTTLAAERGVGLMLSGHTHGGQIWPFGYLVKQVFPPLVGSHQVGGMTLVISRGAGSWGPRMRLWQPGEILKITLRSPGR